MHTILAILKDLRVAHEAWVSRRAAALGVLLPQRLPRHRAMGPGCEGRQIYAAAFTPHPEMTECVEVAS
jgi:hypothetical protein